MKRAAVLFVFGIILPHFHFLPAASITTTNFTDTDRMAAVQSFNDVWETIRDKYYDRTLGSLDWREVYNYWYPQVLKATSRCEVSQILMKLTDTLGVSHVSILPGFFCDGDMSTEFPQGELGNLGNLGCEVRILENRPFVFRVLKNSPAASVGMTYGCEILSIEGSLLRQILSDMATELKSHRQRDLIIASWIKDMLSGQSGDSLKITWQQFGRQPVYSDLVFKACEEQIFQLGLFPPAEVWLDIERLSSDIGYIAFNAFMHPSFLMPKFNDAVNAFMDCRGIIIDLRGNTGGLVNLAQGMASWFLSEQNGSLGNMCYPDMSLKIPIVPRPRCYRGKLAILIDGQSACTAEILAAGLHDAGRARVFGTTTAGAAAASILERLPSGDGFQYATACYQRTAGEQVEGQGIQPDVSIPLSISALKQQIDPVIQAACQWIAGEHKMSSNK
jgi:carboxyl-terminal processing protease